MIEQTKVWKVNGKLVIAYEIEEAIRLYHIYEEEDEITKIFLVKGNYSDLAIMNK